MFPSSRAITFSRLKYVAAYAMLAAFLGAPALAFDPSTDHKCVAYCGGGSAPSSSGSYSAPVYSGPSAAELAAQRRRAQAIARRKRAVSLNDRGVKYLQKQDYAQAIKLYRSALSVDPSLKAARGNLLAVEGQIAVEAERYPEAIARWREALPYWRGSKDPLLGNIASVEGNLAYRAGKLEQARDFFRQALRYRPGHKLFEETLTRLEKEIAAKAETQRHANEERRKQASNPNYPNPPPVYHDANTPRDYPDLASYTPAQHSAHSDNDMGNVWAQKGDWVQAMLNYQKALVEDPDGPFSKVIKENLDIATKHLKDSQQKAATAPAISPDHQTKPEAAPKEISASNCTGWMTANGKSSRLCMDAQAHRYCEEADGKGAVSRVSCQ
jgi:tetratricopeptide (TPR) repeat protein